MALVSYAEKHPHSAYLGKIRTDLSDTYGNVCGGDCPAGKNSTGTDPFIVNTHGNVYYDDIGWWEQAWLDATSGRTTRDICVWPSSSGTTSSLTARGAGTAAA